METFRWKVDTDMGVDAEPKVTVVKLGDGYEQRRAMGLNHNLEKYSVTVRVRREDASFLRDFLDRHAGVKSFLWTPPYGYQQINVVCRKWSVKVRGMKVTLTTTFERVIV